MRFDLHTHSTASDGTLTPLAVWQLAAEQSLDYFALTDHDTLAGYHELRLQPEVAGHSMQLLSGIEISSKCGQQDVHIVGLNFCDESAELQALIDTLQQVRSSRAAAIAARLEAQLGINEVLQQVVTHSICPPWQLCRPHFARWLVAQAVVDTEEQAFKRYLARGKSAYAVADWPDHVRVIAAIQAAGGVAVLAHPLKYGLTRVRLRALLSEFAAAGGDAVELAYQQQKPQDTAYLLKLMAQHELLASGGSDYHGPHMPWRSVGSVPALPQQCTPVWTRFS